MVTLGKADLILVNGQFHTVDRENPSRKPLPCATGNSWKWAPSPR